MVAVEQQVINLVLYSILNQSLSDKVARALSVILGQLHGLVDLHLAISPTGVLLLAGAENLTEIVVS